MIRLRSFVSIVAAAALIVSAGCTTADVAAAEAQAAQVLASIKAGAQVAVSTIKSAVDNVCANGALINSGAQTLIATLGVQSGPQTTQNISAVNKSLLTLNAACAQASANPNSPQMASLLKTAFAAYQAAKASQAAAATSASKGS